MSRNIFMIQSFRCETKVWFYYKRLKRFIIVYKVKIFVSNKEILFK